MQNAEMRERMFTMRLSEDESERLDVLAAHFGLNGAGLIRMLLKEKEREVNETLRLAARGQPGLSPRLPTKASKKGAKTAR